MADREKIIKALENCIGKPKCKDCPWEDCEYEHETIKNVPYGLLCDVLSLLKDLIEKEDEYKDIQSEYEVLKRENEHLVKKKKPMKTNGEMIVRCEYCIFFDPENAEEGDSSGRCRNDHSPCQNQQTDMVWFCADGVRDL